MRKFAAVHAGATGAGLPGPGRRTAASSIDGDQIDLKRPGASRPRTEKCQPMPGGAREARTESQPGERRSPAAAAGRPALTVAVAVAVGGRASPPRSASAAPTGGTAAAGDRPAAGAPPR